MQLWAERLPWQEPEVVFSAWSDSPWCAFLDSGGPEGERSRWQILCVSPSRAFLILPGDTSGSASVFGRMRQMMPQSATKQFPRPFDLPFYGGFIGFVGYACGMGFERVTSRHTHETEPEGAFAFYTYAFLWDRKEKCSYISGFFENNVPKWKRAAQRVRYRNAWETISGQRSATPALPGLSFQKAFSEQSYCQAVAQAREYIAQGDIFQVNITGRYSASLPENFSDLALYRELRRRVPAPFGAYLRCGQNYTLHSASPERFLQVSEQGEISARPIKGTAPRGQNEQQDALLVKELSENEKEQAENLMIVDLMRNDIGRVAQTGSVHVPDLMKVEQFAHVHHLVSEVRGQLRADKDIFDLLEATLPPGSVTGAPKHRAMQIIDELEATARGAYCGSILKIGVDGCLDSSVIIRTMIRYRDRLHVAAGGGVTILSDPQQEYEEMCLKIRPLLGLFGAEP